jgi:hypothetical protein
MTIMPISDASTAGGINKAPY